MCNNKLPDELWIIQSAWGGASFDIHDVYTNESEARYEYDLLRRSLLEEYGDIDDDDDNTDDLDKAWERRAYNGLDQQEYELLSWKKAEVQNVI